MSAEYAASTLSVEVSGVCCGQFMWHAYSQWNARNL